MNVYCKYSTETKTIEQCRKTCSTRQAASCQARAKRVLKVHAELCKKHGLINIYEVLAPIKVEG